MIDINSTVQETPYTNAPIVRCRDHTSGEPTLKTSYDEAMWMGCGDVRGALSCLYLHLPYHCYNAGTITLPCLVTRCGSLQDRQTGLPRFISAGTSYLRYFILEPSIKRSNFCDIFTVRCSPLALIIAAKYNLGIHFFEISKLAESQRVFSATTPRFFPPEINFISLVRISN